jgi:hypothetical protein
MDEIFENGSEQSDFSVTHSSANEKDSQNIKSYSPNNCKSFKMPKKIMEYSISNNLANLKNDPSASTSQNQRINFSGSLLKNFFSQEALHLKNATPSITTNRSITITSTTGTTINSMVSDKAQHLNDNSFTQLKTNAGTSNEKAIYTVPISSSSSKVSITKNATQSKPQSPCSDKKCSSVNKLQMTTSKDGKMIMMPIKVNNAKELQKSNEHTNNNKNSNKIPKENISNSAEYFGESKIHGKKLGNVVTTSLNFKKEWHAPDSYIFDYAIPDTHNSSDSELFSFTQQHWFLLNSHSTTSDFFSKSQFSECSDFNSSKGNTGISFNKACRKETTTKSKHTTDLRNMTRDQRIKIKKINLRRQTVQYWNAQTLRCTRLAQQRLVTVAKILQKLNSTKDTM